MAVSVTSLLGQVREERRGGVVGQTTAAMAPRDKEALATSLLPSLSTRGPSQLPTLHSLLPLLQSSAPLCSSLLPRLLPPLLALSSRPGAPPALLLATLPCLRLLVTHSSSQTEAGKQVAAAVPGLVSTLLPLLASSSSSSCRPAALHLLIALMATYPGSCGSSAARLEAALLELLGAGADQRQLGKAVSLLPQLGGGGKEGEQHSAAHARLLASLLATVHASLDTLLQHVKEFPGTRGTAAPLLLPPCTGSALERNAALARQVEEVLGVLGELLTRGFPAARAIPVELLISPASRLLSLGEVGEVPALLLPSLTCASLQLLTSLITSCTDLLLPEAASINSLLVSGLARAPPATVRRALHGVLAAWCAAVGAASGLELCAAEVVPKLLEELEVRKEEMVLVQEAGAKKTKGKKAKCKGGSVRPTAISTTEDTEAVATSALVALEALVVAVGPWLEAATHQAVAARVLAMALAPGGRAPPPALLAALAPSPLLSPAALALPALHSAAQRPATAAAARAATAAMVPLLHPTAPTLDLRPVPMMATTDVLEGVQVQEEEVEEVEAGVQTEGEVGEELEAARKRIRELEEEVAAQRKALEEIARMDIGAREPQPGPQAEPTVSAAPVYYGPTPPSSSPPSLKERREEPKIHLKKRSAEQVEEEGASAKKAKEAEEEVVWLKSKPVEAAAQLRPVVAQAKPKAEAGEQLSVEDMLKDFSDKLNDNLIKKGVGSKSGNSSKLEEWDLGMD